MAGMGRCEQVLQNDLVDEAYLKKVVAGWTKDELGFERLSSCREDVKLRKLGREERSRYRCQVI